MPTSPFPLMHPRAAGVDVGDRAHFVAVPADRPGQLPEVRRFDTFTQDLYALADWLKQHAITTVALESTGVYWIPLFEVLEARGLTVCLVDTRRLKSVPGRKTDVRDCQWLQQLHSYGLLQSAVRPEQEVVRLRTYLRQREMLVRYAAQHIQHMQKALQQMNIKLSTVLSDITGLTGMSIIEAILAGERNPVALAQLRDPRCQQSTETIAKALEGHWREDHLFELRQAVSLYRTYQQLIGDCDREIEAALQKLPDQPSDQALPEKKKTSKRNPNAPGFDARSLLYEKTGVDLTAIDGIDANTALKIVSEVGTDLSRWPTVKHFTSWLCLCPGNKKSGGKVLSTRSRRSANRVAAALRMASQGLGRSKSALGAYYRKMKSRLGGPAALTAAAHKLARTVYALLTQGQRYVDIGQEAYEQQYEARMLASMMRRAKQLGYQLTPLQNTENP